MQIAVSKLRQDLEGLTYAPGEGWGSKMNIVLNGGIPFGQVFLWSTCYGNILNIHWSNFKECMGIISQHHQENESK